MVRRVFGWPMAGAAQEDLPERPAEADSNWVSEAPLEERPDEPQRAEWRQRAPVKPDAAALQAVSERRVPRAQPASRERWEQPAGAPRVAQRQAAEQAQPAWEQPEQRARVSPQRAQEQAQRVSLRAPGAQRGRAQPAQRERAPARMQSQAREQMESQEREEAAARRRQPAVIGPPSQLPLWQPCPKRLFLPRPPRHWPYHGNACAQLQRQLYRSSLSASFFP